MLVVLQTSGEAFPEIFAESLSASIGRVQDVELFTEIFDFNRFDGASYDAIMARYLRDKYRDTPIDLVIATGPAPLALLARERGSLFSDAPLVFAAVSEPTISAIDLPDDATGIIGDFDVVGTLELARALQPNARRLVVVSGASPLDVDWNARARERLVGIDGLEVVYISGQPVARVEDELGRLTSDSIVILLTMIEDGAGERFIPQMGLVERLSRASAAPIYGVYETWIGHGIVGGHVDTIESLGALTGTIALRILAGESPVSMPIQRGESQYLVDARALDRFALDEARLPAGTVVRFRDPSLWDEYRAQIVVIAATLLLQTLLIVILLLRTRKQRLERELRHLEDRYRNVVEAQTDLVCRYRPDTTLTFVNDAYCRYFGKSREALIGTKFIELVPEADRMNSLRHVQSIAMRPRTETYEHQVLRTDGSTAWQQWIDHAIVDQDGSVVEIQGIGRDITALKRAEREAQEQREQITHLTRVAILGELTATLAHELNQPLTAILNNAQSATLLLSASTPDLDEVREILEDIEADDRRAGEVIGRLRTMLRKGSVDLRPLEINEVVADALTLVHAQVVEQQIEVRTALADGLPAILGDRVQLLQVTLNLVMNAIEVMSEDSRGNRELLIATEHRPDEASVVLAITDNGPGADAESVALMFEPFFTTKKNGLGLGLAICRSIVSAHAGRLWAQPNADRGLTVNVSLPANGPGALR